VWGKKGTFFALTETIVDKMRILKIVFFSVLLLPLNLRAAEVSQEQAAATAQLLMADRVNDFNTTVQTVKTVYHNGQKVYYIVQFAKGGWALISADDHSTPLIGYSGEGVYQTEGQPYNLSSMMDWYAEQVIGNAKHTSWKRHAGWEEAKRPHAARTRATQKVEPLIKVNWNQSGRYQKYCPSDADGTAVVGCVAVGMAQAMSVAQWPDHAEGDHGYTHDKYGSIYVNYDEEPAYNWPDILSGANDRDDVARLLWHCGVSVNMDYGVDGSGAHTSVVASALKKYFKYPESVRYYSRSNYEGDWSELVLTELLEGRAVTYAGNDPKKHYGHCFNLDGYDGAFFHVNWGWGGANNGYFGLDGLKDATMDMNYTDGQEVIVGIRPPSEKPSNILLSNTSVKANEPAGTVVGEITVESEAKNPEYDFKVVGEYSPIFHTNLPAPFKIEDGNLVTTEVLSADDGDRNIEITATNKKNLGSVTRHFTIKVTGGGSGIADVESQDVVSEVSYDLKGVKTNDAKGVNIVRQQLSDGSSKSVKKVRK
jgi:ketosteroid isomerase-like protein